jgi:hypothetical protein
MRILMVLIPDPPGSVAANLSIDRLAEPYYEFVAAGIEVVFSSPDGGAPLVALRKAPQSGAVARLLADRSARDALADTLSLDQVHPGDFEAAFCIGVPGAIWIAGGDPAAQLIAQFLRSGKAVAIIPSHVNLEPHGSHDGLLIVGDRGRSPCQAAQALIGILRGSRHWLDQSL